MPNSRAVEVALLAIITPRGPEDDDLSAVEVAVTAAEPIIRQAEQERIREALLSVEVTRPFVERLFGDNWSGDHIAQVEAELSNALASLDSEQVEVEAGEHTVSITFDGYCSPVVRVQCPPECDQGTNHDGECVLLDWVENCEGAVIEGSITAPVKVEWLNDDSPRLTLTGRTALHKGGEARG